MDNKYQYILFDLDGTLTDPKLGITTCVQYALHKWGSRSRISISWNRLSDRRLWTVSASLRV